MKVEFSENTIEAVGKIRGIAKECNDLKEDGCGDRFIQVRVNVISSILDFLLELYDNVTDGDFKMIVDKRGTPGD